MHRVWRLVSDLIAGRRKEEVRAQLTRGLFPAWLYRTNQMIVVRLDPERVKALPRELPEITIRWGSADDEARMQSIRPRTKPYVSQLEAGALAVLGEVNGQPASFSLFERGAWHESRANGYRFRLGAHRAWAYGMEVKPEYRLSGIFHKHWLQAMRLLASNGVERVYGSVQADNPLSLNSHRRLGFVPLYRFELHRVAGLIHHSATPLDGDGLRPSRGFGRWDGADES